MKITLRFPTSHLIAAGVSLLVAFLFSTIVHSRVAFQQSGGAGNAEQSAPEPLEMGKAVEKELVGGAKHSFQFTLAEGKLLQVSAEQRGIDIEVTLHGPDGKLLKEHDRSKGARGAEYFNFVTAMAGTYRLEIRAPGNGSSGRYELKVVQLRDATASDRALDEASQLNDESVRLMENGKLNESLSAAERALSIRERELGPEHFDVGTVLGNLASIHDSSGKPAKAEQAYQRALAIYEKALGPDDIKVAEMLVNYAISNLNIGKFNQAETMLQRALKIQEKLLGADHPDLSNTIDSLGGVYFYKENYAEAAAQFQRSISILAKSRGENHLDLANPLNNLAVLYRTMGDYDKAEPLFLRALAIFEKAYGREHPNVATLQDNIAGLLYFKGDYAEAERLYKSALAFREKALGLEHPEVAKTLNNLAEVYRAKEEYEKAEPMYLRSIAISEKVFGAEHFDIGVMLNNLAEIYSARSNYDKAEQAFQRALKIYEKAFGRESSYTAKLLHDFAHVYQKKQDFARSEELRLRALETTEKLFGKDYPQLTFMLDGLANLHFAKGDIDQAIVSRSRSLEIGEHNIKRNLIAGSERQKLAYLQLYTGQTSDIIALHIQFAPESQNARRLALTTVLRRKGRGLDAMTDTVEAMRRHANEEDRQAFDALQEARARLSAAVLKSPSPANGSSYREAVEKLEANVEKQEAELSARSAEFQSQSQPVTLEAIQSSIPSNTALVEFIQYVTVDVKAKSNGPPHYAAYILQPQVAPLWVDLGQTATINRAVNDLRQALRDPLKANHKKLARAVDEKVMQPVRKLLGETRQLLISPDGMLNLLPFAALVDERGRYLVENYSISYLSSGRDLLRLQVARQSKGAPMIVANPTFGRAGTEAVAMRSAPPSKTSDTGKASEGQPDFSRISFEPLLGTLGEGLDLKKLLPEATLLTGAQATETVLKQAHAPRLLHIATHGFFLQDAENPIENTRGFGSASFSDLRSASWAAKIENPLLRSGLALAGVNEHRGGDDDGVLTAMETASLDLWGTKLVVLSACDTGIGEVKNGEGVYGLRRSLVLAGAETQVMSLWPVSDKETRGLMVGYYRRLLKGAGRGEALRQVQLEMLKNSKLRHPHYWASFIQAGEWANLDGKR